MRCPRAPVTVGASASTAVVVDALVERVGHLGGVADQQRVLAGGGVGLVGRQGVGGHGDRIPAMQPVVGAVPADGAAHRRRPTVAQRQRRGAFVGVAHAPHLGKVLCPGQIGAQLGEHAAAGLDRRQLMGIADQDRLGPGAGGGGEELAQVVGADHRGFIDHDQRVRAELQLVVAQ